MGCGGGDVGVRVRDLLLFFFCNAVICLASFILFCFVCSYCDPLVIPYGFEWFSCSILKDDW